MYDCSPDDTRQLDLLKTAKFLREFDWSQINACGFYGGEPSINMDLYDRFISLVPPDIPKFVITNGTWSNNLESTMSFLRWCFKHRFYVIISSTEEHLAHQRRLLLEELVKQTSGMELKKPDAIHAQGRAKGHHGIINDCAFTCLRTDRNIRLGLKPDGNIVYQNCHGEYHIVQTYNDHFNTLLKNTSDIVSACQKSKGKSQ
jgi:hypothetical protein